MDTNPIQLAILAKEASQAFIRSGKSLNEVIAKLAEQHDLNPTQIRRVAEQANHDVQGTLYKTAKEKTFTFELADPEAIIKSLNTEEQVKVASVDALMAAVTRPACRNDYLMEALEKAAEDPEQGMNDLRQVKENLRKIASRMPMFRDELQTRHMEALAAVEESISKIASMAKEYVLSGTGKLSDFLKFACARDPDFSALYKGVFEYIRDGLCKLGAPVEKAMISDNLEIPDGTLEVINGGHTLAIELDTLRRKISDEDKAAQHVRLMDTFGNAVVDSIRLIQTPEDVDRAVLEDTWALSKQAEAGVDAFLEALQKEAGYLIPAAALTGLAGGYAGYKTLEGAARGVGREMSFAARPYKERERLRALD